MRKRRVYKKHYKADPFTQRVDVGRFINYIMRDGKKTVAEKVFHSALEEIKKETKEEGIQIFEKAIQNVSPLLEVSSRRVGGANYQVPVEVMPDRRFVLASRWIINSARSRKGKVQRLQNFFSQCEFQGFRQSFG